MFISIDIGGTNIRIAKTDNLSTSNFKYDVLLKAKLEHNFDKDIKILLDHLQFKDLEFVGIGLPGDVRQNILYSSNNLSEWQEKDIQEIFTKKGLKCEVKLDNDGVVAALGEATYGYGLIQSDFLYITWGTGIGGATVTFNNGIPKVIKINWEKYFTEWEEVCGGKNLTKRYNKDLSELEEHQWAEILEDFQEHFINISNLLNNNNIVIGGGATAKQKERMLGLSEKLKQYKLNLVVSDLGDDVGLYGGFALAKYKNKD